MMLTTESHPHMDARLIDALNENIALGNELDAATDGALHHAHGRAADAMLESLQRRYSASIRRVNDVRALIASEGN